MLIAPAEDGPEGGALVEAGLEHCEPGYHHAATNEREKSDIIESTADP